LRNAAQFADRLETADEVAQVFVFHVGGSVPRTAKKGNGVERRDAIGGAEAIVDFTCVG
jgi:hypothetical protein